MRHRAIAPGTSAWWAASALVAVALSLGEAYLLDRKKGFLTGGFLADQLLDTWGERVAFFGGSLVADFGTVAALAAVVFLVVRSLRLPERWSWALSAAAAGLVLGAADVLQFELDRYLGIGVDLGLLFDLTGNSVSEFLAVGWAHLWRPVLVGLVALGVVGAVGGVVARRQARAGAARPRRLSLTLPALVLFLSVATVSAARLASADADDALRRKPSVAWAGDLIETVTDVDRDGYGLLGRPSDPAPLDARVYPYALDQPGNDLDEDGMLGDLPASTPVFQEAARPAPWTSRRHIVLVLLESVRADAVGASWHGRRVTPVLDELAARGASARSAWSHNGYTVQSRHHLLTGTLANAGDGSSLIDDFLASGYQVGYVSGQDDTFGSAALDVGYRRASWTFTARDAPRRRYTRFATPGSLAVPLAVVEEQVTAFLKQRDPARPVFLYVNYHDTHFPYQHRGLAPLVHDTPLAQGEIAPARREALRGTYLNAVANVDASIGRVLRQVRSAVHGDVGVIVVSDHGESLYDRGFLGHGYALDEAQTRIPLVADNVPLVIEEPWGQVQLRSALGRALAADPGGATRPTVIARPDAQVFQYLGALARPRQIAWRTAKGVTAYDVRDRRVLGSGTPAMVDADASVTRLVQFWERMRLAREAVQD
ncbi:MAG TPA: sulfatase-like hydrolase/transferase [Luteitalea sp.]|nr:sulfatase-like hydrolase/transferase [Luteitalea sp.]